MPRAKTKEAQPEELPFETALQRLEEVVDRLEQGDLELEQSLEAFEEGVKLSGRCASQLDHAEQRIEILMKQGGKWLVRPFASGADPGEDSLEASSGGEDFEEAD